MPLPTNIVIIGEDDAHLRFALGFINAYKYPSQRIRPVRATKGKGDAKDFVRVACLTEIPRITSRNTHQTVKLVVIVDADSLTVDDRLTWLNLPEDSARFTAVIVPSPEIEDWVAKLTEASPNSSVRRKLSHGQRAHAAGKTLGKSCKEGNLPPDDMMRFCEAVRTVTELL